MGSRIAPDGGTRISFALLAFALVASLVQVASIAPAQALPGDTGPSVIPGTDTSALLDEVHEWETKNQSRIWWNDDANRWDAILPAATTANGGPAAAASDWWVGKGVVPTTAGVVLAPVYDVLVDGVADNRPDVYWNEADNIAHVLFSGSTTTVYYQLQYSGGANGTYSVALGPIGLPGMDTSDSRAVIYQTSNDVLWAAMMDGGGLYISRSADGTTWPATPTKLLTPVDEGQVALTSVGTTLGVFAAENGDTPNPQIGRPSRYFYYTIAQTAANWDAVTMATGTLTMATNPLPTDTITVGTVTYSFNATMTGAAPNTILIGATAQDTLNNLIAATWHGTVAAQGEGVIYSADTDPHPSVVFDDRVGNNSTMHATFSGVDGNAIPTTGTINAVPAFAAATLTGGASPWLSEPVTLTSPSGLAHADDEVSLVKDTADNVYVATESNDPAPNDPQVLLFKRAVAGGWTQHTVIPKVGTSIANDRKRPVVGIHGNNVYVMATQNAQWESSYFVATSGTGGNTPVFVQTANPLFKVPASAADNFHAEDVRNHNVPRFPTGAPGTATGEGLPVLVDNESDFTIWQTKLPSLNGNNQPPGVYAGEDKFVDQNPAAALGGSVLPNVQGADGPVTSLWTQLSGPGVAVFTTPSSPTTTATFPVQGIYRLRLTATEAGTNPLSNFDDVQIEVGPVNNPPLLNVASPTNGAQFNQGVNITFTATATDPEAGDISGDITWTSSRDGLIGNGASFAKNNLTVGTHTITVRISDGQNVVTQVRTVTIGAVTPPPPPPPGGTPPGSTAVFSGVGDFDGNGLSDLVSYDGSNGRWWVYASNGSKLTATEWARFSTVSGWTTRLVGDFNGDSRTDVANFHPSNGTWWINRSTGTSFALSVWSDYATTTGWGPRLVGDFNGDGRDDIADYHAASGRWWINRGNANNTFTTTLWADYTTISGWKTHVVGDFNGDGKDDIASFNTSNGTWWVNRSTGSSFATTQWADYATASGWTSQLVGDFDNDGKDDITNFHPSNGTWWVSKSTGANSFTAPQMWADYTTASGWNPQMIGDFTGDGRDDIANYFPGNGTWWISRSTGTTFTSPGLWADYSSLTGWAERLVGDFNGDNRQDIANRHTSGNWIISRSTGTSFNTTTWYP